MTNDNDEYPMIDREYTTILFHDMMTNRNQIRFLGFYGKEKMGKSRLMRELENIARTNYHALTAFADLRDSGPMTKLSILNTISNQIPVSHFPKFNEALSESQRLEVSLTNVRQNKSNININFDDGLRSENTRLEYIISSFINDLNNMHSENQKMVFFFDTFDGANEELKKWLVTDFFQRICNFNSLWIIFAGRSLPAPTTSTYRRTQTFQLEAITEIEPFIVFCTQIGLDLDVSIISTLHRTFKGIPGLFAEFVPNLLVESKLNDKI